MAAHQHLKTHTHTHPPQPQTQRLCVYYTKVRRLKRHQIPVLELLSLVSGIFTSLIYCWFFCLFLVFNFFTNPDSAGKMVLLFPSEGSSDLTIKIFTGAYRTARQPLYTHRL